MSEKWNRFCPKKNPRKESGKNGEKSWILFGVSKFKIRSFALGFFSVIRSPPPILFSFCVGSKLWGSFGELWGSSGKAVGKLWGSSGKAVGSSGKLWGSSGGALGKLWGSPGKAPLKLWRNSGEAWGEALGKLCPSGGLLQKLWNSGERALRKPQL